MEHDAADRSALAQPRIGPGAFVAIVGPSGAGKDTLIRLSRAALGADPRLHFVRRIVTRAGRLDDEDHDSIDPAVFDRMERAGEYALSWRAHGLGYALPLSMDKAIASGRSAVANLSRGVIEAARQRYSACLVIEVVAPPEVLFKRLFERGRETMEDVRRRVARSMMSVDGPNVVRIDNGGSLEEACAKFLAAVLSAAG